ncbi:hypothetical protein [Christiangramia sp. SM2212]|uniref:Uncharacterized protein n=1 Tax=Christiangramia sediminicola TaxID=3073267 RepID=A0ABU1EPT9_9FLAO|nr:hypothetical protein [Christiangramia sp. SM2212]MDR5590042.1 hypothetical protein [Christiangramia sp. SM2212]
MKCFRILSIFLILIISTPVNAQEDDQISVGETLEIGTSKNFQYSDVRFPKLNFIAKRGGRASYDQLAGVKVVVSEIKNSTVILKRKDGKKFFGSFPEIKANYSDAIASGELLKK